MNLRTRKKKTLETLPIEICTTELPPNEGSQPTHQTTSHRPPNEKKDPRKEGKARIRVGQTKETMTSKRRSAQLRETILQMESEKKVEPFITRAHHFRFFFFITTILGSIGQEMGRANQRFIYFCAFPNE